MRMRASVLYEPGLPRPYAESRPLKIEELELAPPAAGEVLVEIVAAGLCHSDLSTIEGIRTRPVPAVLGHEAAGIVREVGAGVDDLKEGDHVVMVFVMSCGECDDCTHGRKHLCRVSSAAKAKGELPAGGRRLATPDGKPINHAAGISCFAEYAVVARGSLVKLPEDVPFEDAALFGCAVVTGVGAVVNTAGVKAGEPVCVLGLGGVGLNALMAAAIAGAGPLIAIDPNTDKHALAKSLGATDCIDPTADDALEKLKDLTGGGVRHAIEVAGTVPALSFGYSALRAGGTLTSAGLTAAKAELTIPPYDLVSNEKRVQGSYMGSCDPVRDVPKFLEWYRAGKLPVAKLRSGELPLDEINEGFDRLAAGEAVRQILKPHMRR